ncbi:hypothetical protein ACP4OV_007191 [Aristida adscensionis]
MAYYGAGRGHGVGGGWYGPGGVGGGAGGRGDGGVFPWGRGAGAGSGGGVIGAAAGGGYAYAGGNFGGAAGGYDCGSFGGGNFRGAGGFDGGNFGGAGGGGGHFGGAGGRAAGGNFGGAGGRGVRGNFGGAGRGGGGFGGGSAAGGSGSRSGAPRKTLAALMASRAPRPSMIRRDAMRAGEAAAREVVLRIHPTDEAERRRQDVIDFLKQLIGSSLGYEGEMSTAFQAIKQVFPFGSVPLKTYLPDGDVDITVLANTWLHSTLLTDDVRAVLEEEAQNYNAEFEVKGITFINAEVKLIKCVVENIVVDVSFNQIGGVSTLCFLELVDRKIGKDHLFKRSIMLIKAWCYHESRILGAHHGLLSTYALETLVLYIFNIFHKYLDGPLEALYKFLEYFCKFDWDNYCISLNGPVALSALPNIPAEPTAVHDELLLGKEYKGSFDRLLVVPYGSDASDTNFRQKFLNIIDPLKGGNNLGRSVSKASFYRIRSAFSFGAQKLGQILMLPTERIPHEIYGFFANTLKRHGKGERPDLGDFSSFESLLDPENVLSENGSSLRCTSSNEDENSSPGHSSSLSSRVQDLPPWNKVWYWDNASCCNANSSHLASFSCHSSFSEENGNGNSTWCVNNYPAEEDLLISRSFMPQQVYANSPSHILTNSTRLNVPSSGPVNESEWTPNVEKGLLPPFSPPSMLDQTGDLNSHCRSLQKVQYFIESLFDELLDSIEEECLANVLDEDSFKIPAERFLSNNKVSNTNTRCSRLSLTSSSTDTERTLSPVYCSHSPRDVYVESQIENQVDVIWQQNVPLPSSRLASSSSRATNSENYPVSWFCLSPKVHGTGTYIPKPSYYQERTTPERGRNQRFPDQQYYPFEQGYSGSRNEYTTVHSATNQFPIEHRSSQHDGYSSKSSVPTGSFVPFKPQAAANLQIVQSSTPSPAIDVPRRDIVENVRQVQSSTPSPAVDIPRRDFVENVRQARSPSSSGTVLPRFGQGNPSASSTSKPFSSSTVEGSPSAGYNQLKEKVVENVESGSLGPFSLGLMSAHFEEAFPPLPLIKRPAEVPLPPDYKTEEVPASKVQSPEAVETQEVPESTVESTEPVEAESRPEDLYQLKEADFPPLQAGCRRD